MSLLKENNFPTDIKKLNIKELNSLAEEIRHEIISVVKENGGHLSSNLGIVEATIALYYVFDFPIDKLIFDVGHQCYTHKILSGRRDNFHTIRKDNGISGFPDSSESEYDSFSTGHAGTSISAGLGLCMARDKLNQEHFVVNVVGDGALVNGLNLEALLSSQKKPKKYVLLLNDNGMSISKNKNGFYRFISKSTTGKGYVSSKRAIKKLFGNSFVSRWLLATKGFIKRVTNRRNYFEEFGFKYIELPDGNDIGELVKILERAKNIACDKGVFLHIHTTKGKGHKQAEERADYFHGVSGDKKKGKTFGEALGEKLNQLIEKDSNIMALTAGMKDGTGLVNVEEKHPDNFIDVGIAEEYAVTLSAGMAKGGLKPIVCIYSTFLQRAYDEILHDVCLQNLPVIFMLDRAGLSGRDGKTHQGVFDLSYLTHIPNLIVLAPANVDEMEKALDYAVKLNSPVAIRYPKCASEVEIEFKGQVDSWQELKQGSQIVILAVGPKMVSLAQEIANEFPNEVGVVNARIVKPLDVKYLESVKVKTIITLEENSVIGGFGSLVNAYFSNKESQVYNFGVKDEFVEHGTIDNQLKNNGLSLETIRSFIKEELTKEKV